MIEQNLFRGTAYVINDNTINIWGRCSIWQLSPEPPVGSLTVLMKPARITAHTCRAAAVIRKQLSDIIKDPYLTLFYKAYFSC